MTSFREYMMGAYVWSDGTAEDKLQWAFDLYDFNRNGELDREEMEDIFMARKMLI